MQSPTITRHDDAETDDRLTLRPGVALAAADDGTTVLLDMDGDFFALSEIAAEMIGRATTIGRRAAAETIASACRAPIDRVSADLDGLIAELGRHGAVEQRTRRRRTARIAAGAIARAVRAVFAVTRQPRRRAGWALGAARVSFALCGWSATVDAWRTAFPLSDGREDAGEIDAAVREMAARSWLGVECKERALTAFALARSAGRDAALRIGVAFHPLTGHCWCSAEGHVIGDDETRSAGLIPVFHFA